VTAVPASSYRYLTNEAGIRSGRTIIEGTRIGVHDIVGLAVNGAGVDDVCRSFPSVTRAQAYECLAYYEDHRAKIDDLVAGQMHDPRARSFSWIRTCRMTWPSGCAIVTNPSVLKTRFDLEQKD